MEQLHESKGLQLMEALRQKVLDMGAYRAEIVEVADISTDAAFRNMCKSNACGNYGRSYTCPPDIGEIEDLMKEIKTYEKALVYQTVGELEDSYDFEGMMETGSRHSQMTQKLWDYTDQLSEEGKIQSGAILHLAAGGCRVCGVCGKKTGVPCRHPKRAMASLEAYGINVSELARLSGMKYINGQNTVTYFGAVFYR